LTSEVAAEGRRRGWTRVLDLGTGTGSNLRYLDPRLSWVESWTAVDHDPDLLARITEPGAGRRLRRIPGDLGAEGLAAVAAADLVTASALLDLVSRRWMAELVRACSASGAGALLVLSYDGGIDWRPEEPEDSDVRAAVNHHQERDKGLGAALGPSAPTVAEELFREAGFRTRSLPSPWILEGPADAALARELTRGWVAAALDVWASNPGPLHDWHARRRRQIASGSFRIEVGHRDLLALPAG
jgi:SAM-dependent methyltransferase